MSAPRFCVSVLCHNRLDVTRRCLEAVLANSGEDYELVVTDNASTDGTADYLREVAYNRPWISIVTNGSNLGFQEPNRRAFAGSAAPFFVTLNNDTEVPPGWLSAMAAPFFDDPRVAVCGLSGGCCQLDENFHGFPGPNIEYVEAACMMVRSEFVRAIPGGLFSPYLDFAYGEDSDLCFRCRRLGLHVAHVLLDVRHSGQATAQTVPGMREIQERNHVVLRKLWGHYLRARRFDHPTVIVRRGALGDVFLLEPVLQALRAQRPLSPLYLETDCIEVFQGSGLLAGASRQIQLPQAERLEADMAYENRPGVPIVQAYAEALGIELPSADVVPRFAVRLADVRWAGLILAPASSRPLAAIHAERSWPGKTWPVERFQRVREELSRRGFGIALVGGSRGGEGVAAGWGDLDLRGRATIGQTAAVLQRCALFVGIDSLPMHLAVSAALPTVAIFGASSPDVVAAGGLAEGILHPIQASRDVADCVGARHRVAGQTYVECDGACMRAVEVERVLEVIDGLSFVRAGEDLAVSGVAGR